MKKIVSAILAIICIFGTALADSEFIDFDMTLAEFCEAYNDESRIPFANTMRKFYKPDGWQAVDGKDYAYFCPDSELGADVIISIIFDADKTGGSDVNFHVVQIMFKSGCFGAGITAAARCLNIFVDPDVLLDLGAYCAAKCISDYYTYAKDSFFPVSSWSSGDGHYSVKYLERNDSKIFMIQAKTTDEQ